MKADGRTSWKRDSVVLAVIVVSLGGLLLAGWGYRHFGYTYIPRHRIAEYDGFKASLAHDGDRVMRVWTEINPQTGAAAQLYIRVGDHPPTPVADLPELWVRQIAQQDDEDKWSVSEHTSGTGYSRGVVFTSFFDFVNGRLKYLSIEKHADTFQIGARQQGPFVSVPVPLEEFLAIFGEPRKWSKSKPI